MKSFLLFILLMPHIASAQDSDRIFIDFTEDRDSFPDCKTMYYANGYYTKPQVEPLVHVDLPNVTPVHPAELTYDGYLNFRSFGSEAEKFGSMEFDQTQIIPYTQEEVLNLIHQTADSLRARWIVEDKEYLWRKFRILRQEENTPEVSKSDTNASKPARFPVNEVLNGVAPENNYFRLVPFNNSLLSEEFTANEKLTKEGVQPLLDSLLQPFYFSNYELTNGEYKVFVEWVYDSIELQMAYDSLSEKNAIWLLNCTKNERKSLDPSKKVENKAQFGLTPSNRKKISDLDWFKATEGMYYPMPQRYYRRRERDNRKLIYQQEPGVEIPVYPDTTGFLKEELGKTGEYWHSGFWHYSYQNYPIVNLTKEQILAYCHWKQRQLNERFKEEDVRLVVRPPYLREYEFATKMSVGEKDYNKAFSHPYSYFYSFQRELKMGQYPFYQKVNFDPDKVKEKIVSWHRFRRFKFKPTQPPLSYKIWYQSNTIPYSPFHFLNGNVSEFVLDEVNAQTWKYSEMKQKQPTKPANYVLGTNYYEDVKAMGDDQYNASMYKSSLIDGESSPYVGVRLVYIVERISTN